MPYKSLADAPKSLKGIKPPITLAQANLIASWADGMEKKDVQGNPWALAVAAFKRSHVVRDGMWVRKKESARWLDEYKLADDGWMKLLPVGTFIRGKRQLPITKELLDEVLDNYLQGRPRWGIPITIEHDDDAGKVGKILQMDLRNDGLYGLPEWEVDGQDLIDRRRFDFISPEMLWSLLSGEAVYQDHETGEYHDNVMAAVSLTNKPYFPETALFTFEDKEDSIEQLLDITIDEWFALYEALEELAKAKPVKGVSNKSWEPVKKSTLPPTCFLIVGDRDHPTTWKLPYREADTSGGKYKEGSLKGRYKKAGPINAGAIRAILAAIRGARTGKPMSVPSSVVSRVRSIAKRLGIGKPAEEGTMTVSVDQMAEGLFTRLTAWFEERLGNNGGQPPVVPPSQEEPMEFKVTEEEFEALKAQAAEVEALTVQLADKDTLIQGLAERLDTSEEEAKAEKFAIITESFKALPSTGKTFAADLQSWAGKLGEDWDKLYALLQAADVALVQGELFSERGSVQKSELDSFTALEKAIQARMEEAGEAYNIAATWISQNKPEIMRAYQREHATH